MEYKKQEGKHSQRGQALFLVTVAAVLIMLVCSAMIQVSYLNVERARANRTEEQLSNAARIGVAQSKHILWEGYRQWTQGAPLNLDSADPGNILNAQDYLTNYVNTFTGASNIANGATINDFIAFQTGAETGIANVGPRIWVRVQVERQDDTTLDNTYVRVRSVATTWDPATGDRASRIAAGLSADQRVVETMFHYGGAQFDGFRFALLANSVNCSLCHTNIDNSHRVYNTDPALLGTFERVRVATLESLEMRGNVDTYIAGALYAQGIVHTTAGTALGASGLGTYNFRTVNFSNTDGTIDEDTSDPTPTPGESEGRLTKTAFVEGSKTSGEYDSPYASFYADYDPSNAVDGPLPESFPPVIADDGGPSATASEAGNRLVDDSEWDAHVESFRGDVSGGTVIKDYSGNYNSSSLPTSGSDDLYPDLSSQDNSNPAVTNNRNVILIGTDANPIVINGNVGIDGDLIISGVVKGNGNFTARGNIYVLGDVRYADGTDASGNRTFGFADDGTENVVGYAAGGNIIHGEYLLGDNRYGNNADVNSGGDNQSKWGGDNASGDGESSFAAWELAMWNRMELAKTLPYYDSVKQRPTLAPEDSSGNPNDANVGYIPNYKPRFYTFKEHDQDAGEGKIWIGGFGNDYSDWDSVQITWQNNNGGWFKGEARHSWFKDGTEGLLLENVIDDMDADGPDDDADPGNVLQTLKDNLSDQDDGFYVTRALDPDWISQDDFRHIQINADDDRKSNGGERAFELDGLFYTNNGMIFLSARDSSGNNRIQFNGSVVAADTGMLATNGNNAIRIHYDVRTRNHLTVQDDSEVSFYTVVEREGID